MDIMEIHVLKSKIEFFDMRSLAKMKIAQFFKSFYKAYRIKTNRIW